MSNPVVDEYLSIVSMIGKKNWESFIDVVEGRRIPKNDVEIEALKRYRKVMSDIGGLAENLKVEVTDPYGFVRLFEQAENYWPHKFQMSELERILKSEELINRIAKVNKMSPEKVRTMLSAYRYNLQSPRYGNLEMRRELNVEGYRKDWQAGLEYILGSYDKLSYIQNFGKDVWYGETKLPVDVANSIGKIASPHGREFIINYFKRINDRKSVSGLTNLSRIQRNLTAFKLLLAPVRNVFQTLIGTLPVIGFKNYTQGLYSFITSPKKASKFASDAGAKSAQIELELAELALNNPNRLIVTGKHL